MARIRNLRPSFFKDEHLAELPPLARILFEGLWTLADKAGNLEDRPRFIKVEVLPYDDCDVYGMLDALHAAGFIRRYTASDEQPYIHIPKFTTHQRVSGDEAKAPTSIPPPEEPGQKRRKRINEAGPKQVRSGDDVGVTHVRDRSTEIGVLKSVHCVTDGADAPTHTADRVDVAQFGQSPARRYSPNNSFQAKRKGLSVPAFLHDELLSKMATSDEPALRAWYVATENAYDGRAVGETNLVFWRARFAEWQGTTGPRKVAGLTGGGVLVVPGARTAVWVTDPDVGGRSHRFPCDHTPTCTTWPQCRDHETAVAS